MTDLPLKVTMTVDSNRSEYLMEASIGGSGGLSSTARDLLDYILEHATYTEPDMQEYIDALYIALGGSFTYYTVTNTLTHVSNSNTASQVRDGESYLGTLTADLGYEISSVTVTMGGLDITSTAYDSGVVSISTVTGNVIIIATATEIPVVVTYSITNTLTHVTNSNASISIDANDPYTATLTADTDYTIDSVTITMGNVDITSTAYDSATSTITIANVTGDIVITASADTLWDVKWDYTMGLPNNNGFNLTNNGGTVSLANNGLSIATTESSSSNVVYTYQSIDNVKTEVISELVFEITAFSSQSGSGVRDYATLGGNTSTWKKCAELCLSQNGVQYLGTASGWSTLSATPLSLNTEYTVRIDQTDGNADIYLNGTLIGSLVNDFREEVSWATFGVYRGVSAVLKSYKLKIIE